MIERRPPSARGERSCARSMRAAVGRGEKGARRHPMRAVAGRRGGKGRLQSSGGHLQTFGLRGPASGLLPSSPIPEPPVLGSSVAVEVGLGVESTSHLPGPQRGAGGSVRGGGWLRNHSQQPLNLEECRFWPVGDASSKRGLLPRPQSTVVQTSCWTQREDNVLCPPILQRLWAPGSWVLVFPSYRQQNQGRVGSHWL